jgi:DNA-binding transcriptional ArsR family regulator
MSETEQSLQILVKWNEKEIEFTGSREEVCSAFLNFLYEELPALEAVSKVLLTVDMNQVLKSLNGLLLIAKEGIMFLPHVKPKSRDAVILCLVGHYAGFKMGLLDKDTLHFSEIEKITGEKRGTISGRLSELTRERVVESPEKGEYRITSLGIKYFVDQVANTLKQVKT